jgi:CRISPR-associated exonuclease Cas4
MLPFALLALAILVWLLARLVRGRTGLPTGEVVYSDTGGWSRVERPLFSAALQLSGKPDYLVRQRQAVIPVEVKSGQAPPGGPHPGHRFQLAAYCALVTEAYGRRPEYGLIQYADRTLTVQFTRQLEAELRALLDDMRAGADPNAGDMPRSHDSPARCRACGFFEVCDEALED